MKKTNVKTLNKVLSIIAIIFAVAIIAAASAVAVCFIMRNNVANGTDGADGKTPYIGSGGTWIIGDVDTGIKAGGTSDENTAAPVYAHLFKIGNVSATFITTRATAYDVNDFESLYNDLESTKNPARAAFGVSGCFQRTSAPSTLYFAEACSIEYRLEADSTVFYAKLSCREIKIQDNAGGVSFQSGDSLDILSNSLTPVTVYPLFVSGGK
ncbi:MAG: hypothetical protein K2K60_05030 [Clostridia bacterium]|nr:hypothetical protein [Clostridia bacterium]